MDDEKNKTSGMNSFNSFVKFQKKIDHYQKLLSNLFESSPNRMMNSAQNISRSEASRELSTIKQDFSEREFLPIKNDDSKSILKNNEPVNKNSQLPEIDDMLRRLKLSNSETTSDENFHGIKNGDSQYRECVETRSSTKDINSSGSSYYSTSYDCDIENYDISQLSISTESRTSRYEDADSVCETESVISCITDLDDYSVYRSDDERSTISFAADFDYASEYSAYPSEDERSISGLSDITHKRTKSNRSQYLNEYFFGCDVSQNQKELAAEFVKYIVKNKIIKVDSQPSKEELISLYEHYCTHQCSSVHSILRPAFRIIPFLKSINILKRETFPLDPNKNFIEFKEHVFLEHEDDNSQHADSVIIYYLENADDTVLKNTSFKCLMCRQAFHSGNDLEIHNNSKIHILKKIYRQDRAWFDSRIANLKIHNVSECKLRKNEEKTIEIMFENISRNEHTFCILNVFELVRLQEVRSNYSKNSAIQKGECFKLTLNVRFVQYGARIFPVVLKVLENGSEKFRYLLIEPTFNVVGDNVLRTCGIFNRATLCTSVAKLPMGVENKRCIIADLPSKVETKRCIINDFNPKPARRCIISEGSFSRIRKTDRKKPTFNSDKTQTKESRNKTEVISAPLIAREIEVPKLNIAGYPIPFVLKKLMKRNFRTNNSFSILDREILKKIKKLLCGDGDKILPNEIALTKENYVERFHQMIWIEEFQSILEIRTYTQNNVIFQLDRLRTENTLGIEVEGLSEGRPSVLKGDSVNILPRGYGKKFEGKVVSVEEKSVYVQVHGKYICEKLWLYPNTVEFLLNRTPMRMSHNALDKIKISSMEDLMFPSTYDESPRFEKLKPFFNKSIESNELQKQAITNIVENHAYPAPYILFGPPGTGKTATLVEAILQLYTIFPLSRICVCGSSNTAADVIAERLLDYVPCTDIIRVYGLSRTEKNMSPKLMQCANYDKRCDEVFFPSIKELQNKRIVVMTPVTAGRLVLSGIDFDYLFMDEAGHTVESEMVIPIVGFLRKNTSKKHSGSLILAGDPKQLGPVVRSRVTISMGYGVSLLERLMNQCNLYKKDPISNKYNEKVITKLVNNYRSHEKILHVPNLRFYDNELLAKGSEDRIACLLQWNKLPASNFPIIFHSIKGQEKRESNSPSYFNTKEVDTVLMYVKDLFKSEYQITEKDIGIISPYKKQVLKIRQRLKSLKFDNITVASVEEFQGQERKIIIISTVRSRHELLATDYKFGLGFLRNEKRFNVAITRAMALLIVIGNPDILQCDPHWRAFLKFCADNSSFIGEPASGVVPDDFDPNLSTDVELRGFKI